MFESKRKGFFMAKAALLYSEQLAKFDYGDDHPFKPMRARNTLELCNRYGLIDVDCVQVEPKGADESKAALFHDAGYLEVLKRAEEGTYDISMLERGIGTDDCPFVPNLYSFSLQALGATLHGVEMVMSGEVDRAFNLVGGFHHAERDHAEGFCFINDVGVAIASLLEQGKKVAFVDIDAHHCNGIQNAFYNEPRVLKISLHESGESLYPWGGKETEIGEGEGRGYNVNIPFVEKTDDQVYVKTFRRIVPPLLEAFAPDIVIAEIGADTVISDPLTHLRLTSNGYESTMQELCKAAPKLVACGGGGYDVYRTSKCWTLAWAAMCDREPVDQFAGLVGGMMYGSDMDSLWDRPISTKGEAKEKVIRHAESVAKWIEENVFPIHGVRTS